MKPTTEPHGRFVLVEETEEVCLNCQHFSQYVREESGIIGHKRVPLNAGWCQFHRCEWPAARPPCSYRRMGTE